MPDETATTVHGVPVAAEPLRVLVVDRDPSTAEGLRSWLGARPDIDMVHHGSPDEALAERPLGGYDLCLIDEGDGCVDGVTLGAMLLECSAATRLVLLSGRLTPRTRQRALEHGFRGVLAKPVATAVLSMMFDG